MEDDQDSGSTAWDLVGRRFGNATVLYPLCKGTWRCRCVCGKAFAADEDMIRSGAVTSCGDHPPEPRRTYTDLSGRWYGMLHVEGPQDPSRFDRFVCRCECGRCVVRTHEQLSGGSAKSCGCIERSLLPDGPNLIGMRHHPLRKVWGDLRRRHSDEVCEEWDEYEQFYAWAVTSGWRPGRRMARKDPKAPYGPSNCRLVG